MKSEAAGRLDPELLRQLGGEGGDDELVVAVVRLRPEDPSQIVPPPERTEEIAREVLQRVRESVGREEQRHNVFKNLGYFVVAAGKPFMRELVSQPEVAAAVANVQPASALIEPVKKRPVPPPRGEGGGTPRAAKKKGKARGTPRKSAGKSRK